MTSFFISRSNRPARSRPCWNTLFSLFGVNTPLITSELYPYVHTMASGISWGMNSCGQKGRGCGLLGPGLDRSDRSRDLSRLKKVLSLDVGSGVGSRSVSRPSSEPRPHVFCGWPRRPWMKMMLGHVSRTLGYGERILTNFHRGGSLLATSFPSRVKPFRLTVIMMEEELTLLPVDTAG